MLNSSDRLESNASLTFTYLNGTSNTVKLAIEETSGQKTSLLISKDEDGEIIITASGLKFVEHVEVFPWDDLEDEKKKETTRAVNMAISENYPSLREDHGKRTKGKKLKELTWGEARNIYDAITSTIPQEA